MARGAEYAVSIVETSTARSQSRSFVVRCATSSAVPHQVLCSTLLKALEVQEGKVRGDSRRASLSTYRELSVVASEHRILKAVSDGCKQRAVI